MGASGSKIVPETKQPAILTHYKPSILSNLIYGKHQTLIKAIFAGPRVSPVFKSAKPVSLTVQRQNAKLKLSPLGRSYQVCGWEFNPSTLSTLPPTLLVLQDWTTSPSDLASIVNSLHAKTGMRILIFDLFAHGSPFTTFKDNAGVMSYLLHVLGAIGEFLIHLIHRVRV
jgi:hypothetical protein